MHSSNLVDVISVFATCNQVSTLTLIIFLSKDMHILSVISQLHETLQLN